MRNKTEIVILIIMFIVITFKFRHIEETLKEIEFNIGAIEDKK